MMLYKRLLITALLSVAAVAVSILGTPAASFARVSIGVAVTLAPPALPVYVQPLCPGPGYIWTPGYWAWDEDIGYYWVPGTWVLPPAVGLLWTPGYWDWDDGAFVWIDGYWGPVVGFYGGIDYGFGYTGFGYDGGYWRGGRFYYNRTVNNINVTNITNVYSKTVSNVSPSGASFNGGPGGTTVRPTTAQLRAADQKRFSLTSLQQKQMSVARSDPKQRAAVNKGRPAIAATMKPGAFTGSGVIKASRAGAKYKAPSVAGTNARTSRGIEERRSAKVAPRNERTYRNKDLRVSPESRGLAHQPITPYSAPHSVTPRKEPAQHAYRHNEIRSMPENRGLAHQPIAPHTEQPHVAHQPIAPHAAPHRPEMPHQPQKEHHG